MFAKFLEAIISATLTIFAVTIDCPALPSTSSSSGSSSGGGGGTASIDTNCDSTASRLKKYLLDAGYDENATAGIMGNLMEESGASISIYDIGDKTVTVDESFVAYDLVNDKKTFSGGFGIAQWTDASRVKKLQEYANSYAGGVVASETAQFGYLVEELKKDYSPARLNGRSMEDIAWVVRRSYESPKSVLCTNATSSDVITQCNYPCEAGATCREAGKCENGNTKVVSWNSVNTKTNKIAYDELVNNKHKYWAAYNTLQATIKYAQTAKNLSLTSCSGDSTTGTTDSNDPYVPSTASSDSSSTTASGAIGAESSNGFYRQDNYKTTVWRKDGSTIYESGCSLIAVANSMKVLGVSGSDPKTLAVQTRNVITDKDQTGWGDKNKSIDYLLSNNNMSHEYLWNSYNLLTDTKIKRIRTALASGKAVIAGGDREKGPHKLVSCIDKNSGDCVFSYKGHFIVIVGITSDNRLVVANPAQGNGNGNIYDADNVLKYSNKAISVSKNTSKTTSK